MPLNVCRSECLNGRGRMIIGKNAGQCVDRDTLTVRACAVSEEESVLASDAGESIAEKLDATSSFEGTSNSRSLGCDLLRTVSRPPAGFLVIAAAPGFYAGVVFNRTRTSAPLILKEEL